MEQVPQAIVEAMERKDVKFLAEWLFPGVDFAQNLAPTQVKLIRAVLFKEFHRIFISATTRYGKSAAIAVAMALAIITQPDTKIVFIAPKGEQAEILRDYMVALIFSSPILRSLADFDLDRTSQMKQYRTRTRQTFKNGCEYRIFSAHGEADRLMGHGVKGYLILDERDLISPAAEAKISRMIGDDPSNNVLVELVNPWGKGEVGRKHWDIAIPYDEMNKLPLDHLDRVRRFCRFHVGWEIAVKEGRIEEWYVEQQRQDLTPLEFRVLYESRFPDEAEDQLIPRLAVEECEKRNYDFREMLAELIDKLDRPQDFTEAEYKSFKKEAEDYEIRISCDPADQGVDWTVILWGIKYKNEYKVYGSFAEGKSEPMQIVAKVISIATDIMHPKIAGMINFDEIGIGAALKRIPEVLEEKRMNHVKVTYCHNGKAAINDKAFVNKRAENYYRLRQIMVDGFMDIPQIETLRLQLISVRCEHTSSDRQKIKSKKESEKVPGSSTSPDWADALMYFVWKDKPEFAFVFA